MAGRREVILCCCFFLFALGATAQNVDVTGTWSGEYVYTDRCDNGSTFSTRGVATAQFLQSGSAVQGTVVLKDLIETDGSACIPRAPVTLTLPVTATVSGGRLNGSLIPPGGGPVALTGTASATALTLSFDSQNVTSGTITLTRTSSQPPASGLSGTYDGTYTNVIVPCGRLAPVTYSGALKLILLQTGTTFTGSLTFTNDKGDRDQNGNCTVIDRGTVTVPVVGEINGTTFTAMAFFGDDRTGSVTGTVSGNTISGDNPGEFPGERFTFSVTRSSSGPPAPSISSFTATPSTISAGALATLSWSTVNAASVSIDNGAGSVPVAGSIEVSPKASTTYTLTATGIGGSTSASVTVTVTGTGPRVVAGSFPSGMVQATGESGAIDNYSLANVGPVPASVSLTSSGNFFSISPTSFTLQPGASQLITITASAQQSGMYDGTIAAGGDASLVVPVRLLVAGPPAGSVDPQPTVARVEVTTPSGFASFRNSGSSAMQGIAVSDVPWIVPQSGIITINPAETKNVSFSIDRSKRPDSDALIGGATGSLSLRFLGSPTGKRTATGSSPVSTKTVTVVDVVKPGVSPGTPPPLQRDELALFVAGHGSAAGLAGDLFLSNRSSSPIADLKLFLTAAASQVATLPQLASNLGVTLTSVSTSIFGVEASGSLMLRGTLDNLSAAALRMDNPSGNAAYFSAIPVFRSDRGVAPGGRLVLSGVERSANIRTIVVLQELAGVPGTADIQAYDANGAPIGAKVSLTMAPFVSATDSGNTIIEGARSVAITNTGSGSSRINAYARVFDNSTSDAWIVVDPWATSGTSDSLIAPTITTPAGPAQTDLYVTNTTNAAVGASLNVVTSSNRRRAVRPASLDTQPSAAQPLTIRPFETQKTTVQPANGYLRLSASPGSISASARVTITSNGKSFGSALPVIPVSKALMSGQSRRFSGVGDASAKTIAAGTSATFRTTLRLIETTDQPVLVRVSIWYTFPAGTLANARTVSSKEFTVSANQALMISDLARTVIGPQRDSFGDLRDMQVDVEVIGGNGGVLPFIESIDNGSGDIVLRSE